jgi:hypothetical protein
MNIRLEFGIAAPKLSTQLKGKISLVDGCIFDRLAESRNLLVLHGVLTEADGAKVARRISEKVWKSIAKTEELRAFYKGGKPKMKVKRE